MHYEKFADGSVKCIEEEIPFELPEGWVWERLGNVSTIARGGSPRPIEDYLTDDADGINWIKIGDTEKGSKYILHTKEKIKPTGLSKTRYVQSGDFLLTNSMSFGRPYILKTDGCIHDGWLVIGNIDTVFNQDYLYYALSSGFMYTTLSLLAAGSTVKNLKSDTVRSVLFPIPPLGEQERMAQRLEQLITFVDAINAEKGQLVAIIKQIKSKILDLAIRGLLVPQSLDDEPASVLLERIRAEKEELIKQGKIKCDKKESIIFKGEDNSYYDDIPDGWEVCYLRELFKVCSAKRVKQSDWYTEGVPFYRAREIVKLSDNGFVDNELYISEEHYQQVKKEYGIPQPGDLMVSGVGTIGKVYVVKDTDCFYYKDASVLCFENRNGIIDSQYTRYMLMSEFIQNQMRENSKGTTVDTITISAAMNYICLVPPINEQKRIVLAIEQILNYLKIIELAL